VAGDQRPQHHGQCERQADAAAHRGHCPGADLLPGDVSEQGHEHAGNRAGPLQRSAQNQTENILRSGRHQGTGDEQQNTEDNERLAAPAVGSQAERDLQQALGETVDAETEPDGKGRGALILGGVEHQHRQHHEQPEHPGGVEEDQPQQGPQFEGGEHAGA